MKPFSKVVAASDLLGGHPVWLTPGGDWSDSHARARLFTDRPEAEAALEEAGADPYVIGPYLGDARPGPRGPEPAHFRETFRTTGPTSGHAAAPGEIGASE